MARCQKKFDCGKKKEKLKFNTKANFKRKKLKKRGKNEGKNCVRTFRNDKQFNRLTLTNATHAVRCLRIVAKCVKRVNGQCSSALSRVLNVHSCRVNLIIKCKLLLTTKTRLCQWNNTPSSFQQDHLSILLVKKYNTLNRRCTI